MVQQLQMMVVMVQELLVVKVEAELLERLEHCLQAQVEQMAVRVEVQVLVVVKMVEMVEAVAEAVDSYLFPRVIANSGVIRSHGGTGGQGAGTD